jgi:hypothetical protein
MIKVAVVKIVIIIPSKVFASSLSVQKYHCTFQPQTLFSGPHP